MTAIDRSRYRFGFDIGGTFTDIVVSSPDGEVHVAKCLSRPDAITRAVVDGLTDVIERERIPRDKIQEVISGATTVVSNLIIEGKGASTGLLTTEGFPDLIEIAREVRYDIYDITAKLPKPVVPRRWRKETPERIDRDGNILIPLDEDAARRAIQELVADGVTSIAVCFLHAYRYPAHERRVREIAMEIAPELFVSLSSDVLPEIREYERASATTLNAYVRPYIGNYLEELEQGLGGIGVKATLNIMQSNGGVISRDYAETMPLRMLESGPAAGALAAAHVSGLLGAGDVVSFDMGGTTAKSCLISGGKPAVTTDFETARVHRFKKGSGLPVRLPVIDMMEIGAGGGSIARVDDTGLLKVGPDSAGAMPGPACYGLGGEAPTVTDAALVLGYLDPAAKLGGQVRLHMDRAEQSIRTFIAEPLGMSVIEAASGIYRIVCENMAAAAKVHAVENGKDIRRYTLVAFGGAGPMHAREIARRLGCGKILVPANAGVFSAIGLLVAPVMTDSVRTFYTPLEGADWADIERIYEELEELTSDTLIRTGIAPEQVSYERTADLRYVGQGFEVNTPLPGSFGPDTTEAAVRSFYRTYDELFSHHLTNVDLEALTWRLRATAPAPSPPIARRADGASADDAPKSKRRIFLPDSGEFHEAPVFEDVGLPVGQEFVGPALIEQSGCTTVIGPGERYIADEYGNLLITLSEGNDSPIASSTEQVSPIDLEIYWNRLISIVDEAGAALKRTSFSTVVRESNDYTCVMLDADGALLAQSSWSVPGFIGTAPQSLRHFLEVYPKETLVDGDIILSNNPWIGSGHLNDLTMAAPIFHDNRLVAFVVTVAHLSDIGGRQWSASATELFEEGLHIPVLKLYEAGERNELIIKIFEANVRLPGQVVGDIEAQVVAINVVRRRLSEFMTEYGLDDIGDIAKAIYGVTEEAVQKQLRNIPEGRYTAEVEGDGWEESFHIRATVTVEDGRIRVDYTGSSPQVGYGINESYNHTHAYTVYPFKCMLAPGIPNNDGFIRLFDVIAPEGLIVNAKFPAAVGARQLIGHMLQGVIFAAMAEAMPDKVQSDSGTPLSVLVFRGLDIESGESFQQITFLNGGIGAIRGRHGDPCSSFPANISNTPVEILENLIPVRYLQKRIREGSGGVGEYCGGDGQMVEIRSCWHKPMTVSLLTERTRKPPRGILGGNDGACGFVRKNGTPVVETKGVVELAPGDVLEIGLPGAGGLGAPIDKDAE
jgi:5-oxoprolinase (ATP-hydrolysing)/N-methylhydantoinase A